MNLDYFISSHHPAPQLHDGHSIVTVKVFKKVKKEAPHLLRYFSIHFDEHGREDVRCTIPPAFEGHILTQLTNLYKGHA